MTDTDRKLLTLYLGEFWYDKELCQYERTLYVSNRTFDNWDDLGALKERLADEMDYVEFSEYCYSNAWAKLGADIRCEEHMFDGWLYTPTRFPELVAEWLKSTQLEDRSS